MAGFLVSLVKRGCGIETLHGHTFAPNLFSENPLVLDFGCNRGEFAFAFRRRFSCRYLAADANPLMVAATSERLGLQVEHIAVGGHDGHVEFFLSDNPEASSIYPGIAGHFGGQGSLQVPMVSYAAYSRKHGIDSVELLKLDIEGAELELLENWDGRIARPAQISVEFHDFLDSYQLPRVRACIKRLRSYGYKYLNLQSSHMDCLFVDKSRLRDNRGLLLTFCWLSLSFLHVIFGWKRTLRTGDDIMASSARPRG